MFDADINYRDIFRLEDKYNNDINVTNLYRQFNHLSFPRSEYLGNVVLSNNNLMIITHIIRSIPRNLHLFLDLILSNFKDQLTIIGLRETRLCSHFSSLYQLPGFNLFTSCRSTYGGGVALYIRQQFNHIFFEKYSILEPIIECIGIEIIVKKALCIKDY